MHRHVLKPETTKRNGRNETTETSETTAMYEKVKKYRPGENFRCHDVTHVDFRGARSGCHGNVTEIKVVIFQLFHYLLIILLVSAVSVVSVVSFRSFRWFRWFRFGRFAGFGGFACFGRFGGFVSLVSVVSFRPFRFVVSGFSACRMHRGKLMVGSQLRGETKKCK